MEISRITRRATWLAALGALVVLTVFVSTASARMMPHASQAQTPVAVSLRLDFFHSETHAAFFAAKDRGYWQRQGLDVTVLAGPGLGVHRPAGCGRQQQLRLGERRRDDAAVARGADVIAVGSMRQVFDGGIAFWPDTGIRANNPKSLEGKTCAMTASGFIALLFPVYVQKTGIDRSKITERVLDGAVGNSLFGAHQVDCYESTVVQSKYFFPPRNGVSPGILRYSDVPGMSPLGFTIIQNSRQLRGNPA